MNFLSKLLFEHKKIYIMKSRLTHSGGVKSGISSLMMVMSSFLACFYIAGRLWEEADLRVRLSDSFLGSNQQGEYTLSIDDTLKRIDCRDKTKRLEELEIELAAARSQGHNARPPVSNVTSYTHLHAVIGINTGFNRRPRRDFVRKTWMPSGTILRKFELNKGIVIRFLIGRSAKKDDRTDQLIRAENAEFGDMLILDDHLEDPDQLSRKIKAFFSIAVEKWDADFYVKVEDNVFVHVDKLGEMLATHWDKPSVYIGCMKSGVVFSEPKQMWYEPEWLKFGDKKSYFLHAEGQLFVLSKSIAQFISINGALLHSYHHDDVSVGAWLLGLNVDHVDERRLCCTIRTHGAICEMRHG